jgi:hypothetical protein
MRRVEPAQCIQFLASTLTFALLFARMGWLAALLLGAPLGAIVGLAMALTYC